MRSTDHKICIVILLATILFTTGCEQSTNEQAQDAFLINFSIEELPEAEFEIDHETGIINISNYEAVKGKINNYELTANFLASKGASVFVNEEIQHPGRTTNDYALGLYYTVVSKDGQAMNNYFVHLNEKLPKHYLLSGNPYVDLNPFDISPLSAYAYFNTKEETKASITILGEQPISQDFNGYKYEHRLPVLGLYPNTENQVELTLTTRTGLELKDTLLIQTKPLPEFLPDVRIDVIQENRMEPGMHFNEVHIGNDGKFNSYPLIHDNNGDVRWFIDLSQFNRVTWPIQFNDDGSFFAVFGVTVIEFDKMGRELNRIIVEGYEMHHEVIKIPNGNYVIAVSDLTTTMIKNGEEMRSVEDYIIEIDPAGNIITEWDMAEVLDVNRVDVVDGGIDWFHMNAIWYDERDHSIIISGRNQGLVKVNWENELQWIMAPHKGWGVAGREQEGEDTSPYLLTAVDATGQSYNETVQLGETEIDEFNWVWGQHKPMILPSGNLFVFDNGTNRNFGNASLYSAATEYKIDEENMTVQQVWSYGKERGDNTFSNIISDVHELPETGNRIFAPGYITTTENSSKIIEVSYPDKEVIFESTLLFKDMLGNQQGWGQIDITYRANRVFIY